MRFCPPSLVAVLSLAALLGRCGGLVARPAASKPPLQRSAGGESEEKYANPVTALLGSALPKQGQGGAAAADEDWDAPKQGARSVEEARRRLESGLCVLNEHTRFLCRRRPPAGNNEFRAALFAGESASGS